MENLRKTKKERDLHSSAKDEVMEMLLSKWFDGSETYTEDKNG